MEDDFDLALAAGVGTHLRNRGAFTILVHPWLRRTIGPAEQFRQRFIGAAGQSFYARLAPNAGGGWPLGFCRARGDELLPLAMEHVARLLFNWIVDFGWQIGDQVNVHRRLAGFVGGLISHTRIGPYDDIDAEVAFIASGEFLRRIGGDPQKWHIDYVDVRGSDLSALQDLAAFAPISRGTGRFSDSCAVQTSDPALGETIEISVFGR
jgi:hypothetical protein